MKINCIATGSSGNLFEILDSAGNSMLIEAGMPRSTYVKYRIGKTPPEMCIISHGHFDHSKYKGEFEAVIPVYFMEPQNRSEHFSANGYLTKHGEGQTMVFIIWSKIEEKFLFFGTDFELMEYNSLFLNLKHYKVENFLIECNYNDFLIHCEDVSEDMKKQCGRHLSDNDVINFIKKSCAKNPKIITIHGSNRLSADTYTKKYLNSKLMTATVQVATGVKENQKNIFII